MTCALDRQEKLPDKPEWHNPVLSYSSSFGQAFGNGYTFDNSCNTNYNCVFQYGNTSFQDLKGGYLSGTEYFNVTEIEMSVILL